MAKNYNKTHHNEYKRRWADFHDVLMSILMDRTFPYEREYNNILNMKDPKNKIQALEKLYKNNRKFEEKLSAYSDFIQTSCLDPNECPWLNDDEIDEVFEAITIRDLLIAYDICCSCQDASLETYRERIDTPFFPPKSIDKLLIIERKYPNITSKSTNGTVWRLHSSIGKYQKKYDKYYNQINKLIEEHYENLKSLNLSREDTGMLVSLDKLTDDIKSEAIASATKNIDADVSQVWLAMRLGNLKDSGQHFMDFFLEIKNMADKYYKDKKPEDGEIMSDLTELFGKYDPFKTRYLPEDWFLLGLVFKKEDDFISLDQLMSRPDKDDKTNAKLYYNASQLNSILKKVSEIEQEDVDWQIEQRKRLEVKKMRETAREKHIKIIRQNLTGDNLRLAEHAYLLRCHFDWNVYYTDLAKHTNIDRNTAKYMLNETIPDTLRGKIESTVLEKMCSYDSNRKRTKFWSR